MAHRSADDTTDDAGLVRDMRRGEERCFETIFRRHHAPLLSYCRHMLGNREEAEDALQQSFIRAHRALLGDNPPGELRPWLYAIARNCCLSAIAARRSTGELHDDTPSLAGLTQEVYARQDLRDLVGDIGRLPEDQRSALLLSELEDLDHRAIATIVGCPVSKVKALVYQARTTLIAERAARESPCQEIRERLTVARGGELRRGPLRRHLSICPGCRDFQSEIAAQRQSLASVLPVLPSAGLAARVLGHAISGSGAVGIGAGAAGGGAGGAATAGSGALTTGGAAGGAGSLATAVGAGGGASFPTVVGGGLIGKLALGGAVAVLATAGATGIPARLAHASTRHAGAPRVTLSRAGGGADRSTRLSASAIGQAALTTAAGILARPAQNSLSFTQAANTSATAGAESPTAGAAPAGSLPSAGLMHVHRARLVHARARRQHARRLLRHRLERKAAMRRRKAALARRRAAARKRRLALRRKRVATRRRRHIAPPVAAGPLPQPVSSTSARQREARRSRTAAQRRTPTQSTPAITPTSGSTNGGGGVPSSPPSRRRPHSSPDPQGAGEPEGSTPGHGPQTGSEGAGEPAAEGAAPSPANPPGESPSETPPARRGRAGHPKKTTPESAQPSNLGDASPVTPVDANN